MRHSYRWAAVTTSASALVLLMAGAPRAGGQSVPVGSEFQANSAVAGNQDASSVAMSGGGSFVVVWSGPQPPAGDGVFARRFDAAGAPLGGDFKVNTDTQNLTQRLPNVASTSAAGAFVVVWRGSAGAYFGNAIKARRYDAAGTALDTPELDVFTSSFNETDPAVAADSSGNFVVVWGDASNSFNVTGRRYTSAGAPVAAAFPISGSVVGEANFARPAVARAPAGAFVVSWDSTGVDADSYAVSARLYNAAGTPVTAQFQVNTATTGRQWNSSVAIDAAGNFVVAWQDGYGGPANVKARIYSSAGAPVTGEITVNTAAAATTTGPVSAAADDAGNFVVTWSAFGLPADSNTFNVFRRSFNSSGAPLTSQLLVNTTTTNGQFAPWVSAVRSTGAFTVVWPSQTQDSDGSQGIYGQRFNQIVPVELRHFDAD